jgi:hypothetical protein
LHGHGSADSKPTISGNSNNLLIDIPKYWTPYDSAVSVNTISLFSQSTLGGGHEWTLQEIIPTVNFFRSSAGRDSNGHE